MPFQNNYFADYHNLKLTRDDKGVLIAEFHRQRRTVHHDRAISYRICRCLLPDCAR